MQIGINETFKNEMKNLKVKCLSDKCEWIIVEFVYMFLIYMNVIEVERHYNRTILSNLLHWFKKSS